VFDLRGYTFLIDKSLLQTASPIQIDGTPYGFRVNSQLSASGGGCSSCTDCG
jgi:hypothetical protein